MYKFDKDLLDIARGMFYKVYVVVCNSDDNWEYRDDIYDGDFVMLVRTDWDYEEGENILDNNELRDAILEIVGGFEEFFPFADKLKKEY